MILDSTLRKLQVSLTTAKTTNDMSVVIDWVDNTTTTFTPGLTPSNTNGTTLVDILAAPAASTQRKVNSIIINNLDTASKIVQVFLVDNVTSYKLIYVTLQVNETLGYTDTEGWYVMDTSGAIKGVGPTGATGASGPQGSQGISFLAALDGNDGEDGMMGPRGLAGTNGSVGPQGFSFIAALDGQDGEDGMSFPSTTQTTSSSGGSTFYNVLPSDTTVATNTSYIVVNFLDTNGFTFTINGYFGILG